MSSCGTETRLAGGGGRRAEPRKARRRGRLPRFALPALLIAAPPVAATALAQVLSTDGVIESTSGGFKFPDGTIQTSAGGGASYERVLVVAKSGGHFSSIQAAIDSITDAAPNKAYLVRIAPGVYAETVAMSSWVYLQGAGRGVTVIQPPPGSETCVSASSRSGLRELSVVCDKGDASLSVGVSIVNKEEFEVHPGFRMVDVSVVANGAADSGDTRGVFIQNARDVHLIDVTAEGRFGAENVGIYGLNVDGQSEIFLTRVQARGARGGFPVSNTVENWGLRLENSALAAGIDVTAEAIGGGTNRAVQVIGDTALFDRLTSHASGFTVNTSLAVESQAAVEVRRSSLHAGDAESASWGILTQGSSADVTVSHSLIEATGNTVFTVTGTTFTSTHCDFIGGPVTGSGTEECRYSTDEGLTTYTAACPP